MALSVALQLSILHLRWNPTLPLYLSDYHGASLPERKVIEL